MAMNAIDGVIGQVRRAALRQEGASLADGELLECYLGRRDEVAFEALVRRHGPMVMGVCRRILGNEADAEDAFQATFLVFVRKAASIRCRGQLANWLYGVAHNTALKARAMIHKRRTKEREAAAAPKPEAVEESWQRVQVILDDELSRLPDKYRIPIVLCELEGRTVTEAARHLGWPRGTVATRLSRGRALLARRLARHGLTVSGGALAAVLSHGASAAGVPVALVLSTVRAAGPVAAAGVVPAQVAGLAEAVVRGMVLTRLKVSATALLAAILAAVGTGMWAYQSSRAGPVAANERQTPDSVPGAAKPSETSADKSVQPSWGEPDHGIQARLRPRQVRWKVGESPTFDLDLRNQGEKLAGVVRPAYFWEVEVDGTWYGRRMERAAVQETPLKPGEEFKDCEALRLDGEWLRGVRGNDRFKPDKDGEALPLTPGKHRIRVAYHPHAELCAISNSVEFEILKADAKENPPRAARPADPGWIRVLVAGRADKAILFRPDGTKRTETNVVPVPFGGHRSPGGKSVVFVKAAGNETTIHVADADGKNARQVSPDKLVAGYPAWSPDGKRIAFAAMRGQQWQVHVMDRNGENVRQITDAPLGAETPKFSPNGRLAYLVWGDRQGKNRPADLVIFDDKAEKPIAKNVVISDFVWGPDGATIAYGKPGALVFHDIGSGKAQEIAFADVDKRLANDAAVMICWSPDSRAVACSIVFWGGRRADGPKMFGDDELFVIPRAGGASWFELGEQVRHIEWVNQKE
jgi:RNA polymerase sigma factor (sigma-70 family)